MISLLVPLGYLLFIVGSLTLFSKRYRQKTATKKQSWFPRHEERDLYVSLLSDITKDNPEMNISQNPFLTGALIRRAMADVKRMGELQLAKQALNLLLQRGQIGDDLWNQLLDAEKEMEAELMELIQEANAYRPGWGQSILPHAADMVQHENVKKVFEGIEKDREKLQQRERIQKTLESNQLIAPAPILSLAAFQPVGEVPQPPAQPLVPAAKPMSRVPSAQAAKPLGPGKPAQQQVTSNASPKQSKPPPQANGATSVSAESSEDEAASPKTPGSTGATPAKKKKKNKKKK